MPLKPWQWANRQATYQENEDERQKLRDAVQPAVEAGDFGAARQALAEVPTPSGQPDLMSGFAKKIGDSLRQAWTNPDRTLSEESSPGLGGETNTRTVVQHTQRPGETFTPDDYEQPAWKRVAGKVLEPAFRGAVEGEFGSLKYGLSGENTLGALGVDSSGLPGPLRTAVDIGAAPLTLLTAGAGGVPELGAEAGAEASPLLARIGANLARRWGTETAIGTAGTLTSQGVEEKLPEGTPEWLAKPLELGAGVVAGAVTANPKAAIGPGSRFNNLSRTALEHASLGTQAVDEAGLPLSRYAVPDLGTGGAAAAIATKQETLREPGALFQSMPDRLQKLVGKLNPNATMPQEVVVAHAASTGTKAALETEFNATMEPVVSRLERALADEPPTYHGPAGNPIAGTFKDIADHPDHYALTPEVSSALDAYDQAQWGVSAKARGEYGVDVEPYDNGIPGSVYTPTVPRRDSLDIKAEAAAKQLSSGGRTKERAYAGAYDRTVTDPTFQPETDLRELTRIHNSSMATAAANNTFKQAVPGQTARELMAQTHPELTAQHDELVAKVASLREKLRTAERRAGVNTTATDELDKVLDDIASRVPEGTDQLGRLGTVLGNENERAGNLMGPTAAPDRVMTPGGPVRQNALPGETPSVPATPLNLAKGEGAAHVIDAIAQVVPENVDQLRFLETAIQRSLRRASVLEQRGGRYATMAKGLRAQLESAQGDLETVGQQWRTANPARGTDMVLNRSTFRYHPADESAAIDSVVRQPTGVEKGMADVGDELRAFHLAGDASPFTIQGTLGLFSSPLAVAKTVARMIGENPLQALNRIARELPEDVRQYAEATGRRFGDFGAGEYETNRGLARLPVVGGAIKAGEDQMFAAVQRIHFEAWKADRDHLLRMNPGMSPAVAAAESANTWSKLIPSLNPTERAVSPARRAVERFALTSTSFATAPALLVKDATSGLVKLARAQTIDPVRAWRTLDGREQLALQRGTTMAGSLLTISATSAALAASSRGMSVQQAIKEQFDPNSRYFLSLQFGGGHSIPIGGPFRSFVKGLMPVDSNGVPFGNLPGYLGGKLNTPLRLPGDLVRNEDFTGNEIYHGNIFRPENALRALAYGAESIAPLGVGQAATDARTGDLSLSGTGERTAGQLLGTNLSPPSTTEQLDQIARSRYGSAFYDLSPSQQKSIKQSSPALWADAVAAGSPARRQYESAKTQTATEQAADDQLLQSGQLSVREWQNAADQRRYQLLGAQKAIYAQAGGGKQDKYLAPYFDQIDKASTNGRVDWTKVNAWLDAQPQVAQDYISENTGLNATPLGALTRKVSQEYNAIPEYRGVSADDGKAVNRLLADVHSTARKSTDQDAQMAYNLRALGQLDTSGYTKAQLSAARRAIVGSLPKATQRAVYAKAHPEVALLSGGGKLGKVQMDAIARALGD